MTQEWKTKLCEDINVFVQKTFSLKMKRNFAVLSNVNDDTNLLQYNPLAPSPDSGDQYIQSYLEKQMVCHFLSAIVTCVQVLNNWAERGLSCSGSLFNTSKGGIHYWLKFCKLFTFICFIIQNSLPFQFVLFFFVSIKFWLQIEAWVWWNIWLRWIL